MSGFDRFLELEGMWLNFLCIIFGHSSSDSSLIAFLYLLTYQRIGQSFWVVFTSMHLICFRKRKKVCDQNFVKVLHICMHWSPPSAPLPPSLPPKTVSFHSLEWWSPGLPCIHATLPVCSLSARIAGLHIPSWSLRPIGTAVYPSPWFWWFLVLHLARSCSAAVLDSSSSCTVFLALCVLSLGRSLRRSPHAVTVFPHNRLCCWSMCLFCGAAGSFAFPSPLPHWVFRR